MKHYMYNKVLHTFEVKFFTRLYTLNFTQYGIEHDQINFKYLPLQTHDPHNFQQLPIMASRSSQDHEFFPTYLMHRGKSSTLQIMIRITNYNCCIIYFIYRTENSVIY